MSKFVFLTQSAGTATRTGPSGTNYVINKGYPFKVTDKRDIEYFSKFPQRFQKVGLLTPAPEPKEDVDELLRGKLSSVKGLSKKNVDLLVETYHSEENLVASLEQGNKLDIPEKQSKLVEKLLMKDMSREEDKESNPIEEDKKEESVPSEEENEE